jgi:uncharacterized protein YjdB
LVRLLAVKAGQKSLTLVKGQKVRIKAFGYKSDGTRAKVTWASSNAKKVKVSKTGMIRGLKVGKAKVSARSGALKSVIKVRVVAAKTAAASKVKKIKVKVDKTMTVGQAGPVKVTFTPAAVARAKVVYTSSNKAVLTVDKAGWAVAKKAGSAKVTVKVGGKKKAVIVKVG